MPIAIFFLAATAISNGALSDCARLDPDLVYCPAVQAPRITELSDGFVVLEITVNPDGSVKKVHIVRSDPDKQWNAAAVKTVSRWRYKSANKSTIKSQRLVFSTGH